MRRVAVAIVVALLVSQTLTFTWGDETDAPMPRDELSSTSWNQTSYEDFAQGKNYNTEVNGNGSITLSSIKTMQSPYYAYNTTCAVYFNGYVYGGLSDGTIFRINCIDGTFLHMGHPIPGSQNIPALMKYGDKIVGISNPSGIIFSFNGTETEYISSAGENITSATLSGDEIWGALEDCRIFSFDMKSKKFTYHPSPAPSEKRITSVDCDPDGGIWLGTSPSGHVIKVSRNPYRTQDFGRISENITEISRMIFTSENIIVSGKGNDSSIYSFKRSNFSAVWKRNTVRGEKGVSDMLLLGDRIWGGTYGNGKLFRMEMSSGKVTSWDTYQCLELGEFTGCGEFGIWAFASHGCAPVIINSSISKMDHIKFVRKKSGKLFMDRFESGSSFWKEENIIGGLWEVKKDNSRPRNESMVYSQTDASAASTFSLSGDFNWTDYTYTVMLKFDSPGMTNPSGNGVRIPVRNGAGGDRFLVNLYKTQGVMEIWKVGSQGTAKLYEKSVFIGDTWHMCRITVEGERIHVFLNGTRLTPSIGVSTGNAYPRGGIGIGTRYYSCSFDNATVYSSEDIKVNALPDGTKVSLHSMDGEVVAESTAKNGVAVLSNDFYPFQGYFRIELKNETYTSCKMDDIFGGDIYEFNASSVERVYFGGGKYESAVYDAKYSAPWLRIEWEGHVPDNTSMNFSVRAADSIDDIRNAKWKDVSMGTPIGLKGEFFQYLVKMTSNDGKRSPVLEGIRCIYGVLSPNITLKSNISSRYLLPNMKIGINLTIKNSGDGTCPHLHMYFEKSEKIEIDNVSFLVGDGEVNGTDILIFNMSQHSVMNVMICASASGDITDGEKLNITVRGEYTDAGGKKYYLREDIVFTGSTPIIEVKKMCHDGFALSNGTVQYEIFIENKGSSDAHELVIVEEPSPGQKILNSSDDERRDENIWRYPVLPSDGNITLNVNFSVEKLPNGTVLMNKITVSYTDELGNHYKNITRTILVPVKVILPPRPKIDVRITMPEVLLPGEMFEVFVEYENVGTAECNNSTLKISIPSLMLSKSFYLEKIDADEKGNESLTVTLPGDLNDGNVIECRAFINGTYKNRNYTWNNSSKSVVSAPHLTANISLASEVHHKEKIRAYLVLTNSGSLPAKNITLNLSAGNCAIVWNSFNMSNGTAFLGDMSTGVRGYAFEIYISGSENEELSLTAELQYMHGYSERHIHVECKRKILLEHGKDVAPPVIIMTQPRSGRTDVPVDEPIFILFSEPMNETSVNKAFSISPSVKGELIWMGTLLVFRPNSLEYNTEYTVKISANACDRSGNKMNSTYIFTFTTSEKRYDWGMVYLSVIAILLTVILIETFYIIKKTEIWKKDEKREMMDEDATQEEHQEGSGEADEGVLEETEADETEEMMEIDEEAREEIPVEEMEWESAEEDKVKEEIEDEKEGEEDVEKVIEKMLGR